MDRIRKIFQPLYGRPCWGVRSGQGGFLTFEFGDPRLEIREPGDAEPEDPEALGSSRRREVYVKGEWYLWIYCCDWEVQGNGGVIGDSSSKDTVEDAARYLEGQKIVGHEIELEGMGCRFEFDLGGVLTTKPYDASAEQFLLYQPDGYVLSVRGDGQYSHQRGDTDPAEDTWQEILPERSR